MSACVCDVPQLCNLKPCQTIYFVKYFFKNDILSGQDHIPDTNDYSPDLLR
jgi:hypothetical protein